MASYAIAEWKDFFVAVSGAAAALAGLLFVGLSLNLARILALPGIPGRAGETLLLLGTVLVSALLGLVPQPLVPFGLEILSVGLLMWSAAILLHLQSLRHHQYDTAYHGYQRIVVTQVAILPLLAAAGSVLLRFGGGLYWLVPGLIFPLLVSMINAWVLLVEIMR